MRTFTSRILDPSLSDRRPSSPRRVAPALRPPREPVGVTVGGRPPAAALVTAAADLRPLCPRSARTPMRSIPHPSQIPLRTAAMALTPALGALAVLLVA